MHLVSRPEYRAAASLIFSMKKQPLLLVCGVAFAALACSASAGQIVSQSRAVLSISQVLEAAPDEFDEETASDSTATAGLFARQLATSASVNQHAADAAVVQETTVNLGALSFSGSGGAESRLAADFGAAEPYTVFAGSAAESRFEVVFSLSGNGRLRFSSMLAGSNPGPGAAGGGNAQIIISQVGVNPYYEPWVWSRAVGIGMSNTFNGDISLKRGTYRVRVVCTASNSLESGAAQRASATSFQISGQIIDSKR